MSARMSALITSLVALALVLCCLLAVVGGVAAWMYYNPRVAECEAVECVNAPPVDPELRFGSGLTGMVIGVDIQPGQRDQYNTVARDCWQDTTCIELEVATAEEAANILMQKGCSWDVHVFHAVGLDGWNRGEARVSVEDLRAIDGTLMLTTWEAEQFPKWTPSSSSTGSSAPAPTAVPQATKGPAITAMVIGVNMDSSAIDCGTDCARKRVSSGQEAENAITKELKYDGYVHVVSSGIRGHGGPDGEACVLADKLSDVPGDGNGWVVISWGCSSPFEWPIWPTP
jgi:hypothetical protein